MYPEQGSEILLDLGRQPISNRFLSVHSGKNAPHYPVRLMLDNKTGTIHLESPFPVKELKPRFDWLTCFEPEDHLDGMVKKIIDLPNICKNMIFSGFSFKDDSTLNRLKAKDYRNQWRIDPQKDLGVTDLCANIETFQSMFNVAKAKQIQQRLGYADVMIVRHVLEHVYDLQEFVSAISFMIQDEGYIVWEVPDCQRALDKGDCTTVWEEHTCYFTSFTFKQMLENSGLAIIHYESVHYPLENSLVAITKKKKQGKSSILINENAVNVENNRAYQFAQKVNERKKAIQSKLRKLKNSNGSIVLFGAGHLSVTFISIMGIADLIDFVIDDNPHKNGMIMPIGGIEILGSDSLYSRKVNLCLLGLNPQNQPMVIANHLQFTENGGKFASIFPGTTLYLEKII